MLWLLHMSVAGIQGLLGVDLGHELQVHVVVIGTELDQLEFLVLSPGSKVLHLGP